MKILLADTHLKIFLKGLIPDEKQQNHLSPGSQQPSAQPGTPPALVPQALAVQWAALFLRGSWFHSRLLGAASKKERIRLKIRGGWVLSWDYEMLFKQKAFLPLVFQTMLNVCLYLHFQWVGLLAFSLLCQSTIGIFPHGGDILQKCSSFLKNMPTNQEYDFFWASWCGLIKDGL